MKSIYNAQLVDRLVGMFNIESICAVMELIALKGRQAIKLIGSLAPIRVSNFNSTTIGQLMS